MALVMSTICRFKPLAAMVALQFGYAAMNIMNRAALTCGMNPYSFIVYRQAVAALVISPFAYFFERKERPALKFSVFCQIFLLSMIGITINQCLYFKGLYLSSSTFVSSMSNLIPAMTFLIATVTGLESINLRCVRGQAKVLGTFICVGGAMIMALYKGPIIGKLWPPNFHMNSSHYLAADNFGIEDWKMGSLCLFGSSMCWSAWIVLQVSTLNKYSAQLSLTAWMCFLGAAQSTVVTLVFEPDLNVWTLEWNFNLFCIIYSGIVCSAIAICVQTWCVYKRGPVFVAMFNPLQTIIVAIMASVILHEKLHVGSVVGAILIAGGLYAVLWGQAQDRESNAEQLSVINLTKGLPVSNQNIKSGNFNIDIREPLLANKASDQDSNT